MTIFLVVPPLQETDDVRFQPILIPHYNRDYFQESTYPSENVAHLSLGVSQMTNHFLSIFFRHLRPELVAREGQDFEI